MAITDVNQYAHLTDDDVAALGRELDELRLQVEASRGTRDARYLRRTIIAQRVLDASARLVLWNASSRSRWLAGTAMLSLAKVIENMELGHNIMHGQWDWMNDPEVHSSSWEWDMVCASPHWKHSHNVVHHKYTNVLGMDHDVGYRVLRVTRDDPWETKHLFQPLTNLFLAATFEWGIALHDLELKEIAGGNKSWDEAKPQIREFVGKVVRQLAKDYVIFPALSAAPSALGVSSVSPTRAAARTIGANLTANLVRNFWAHTVIFCGHFPDGAEKFTPESLENEQPGQWYLRQMLGTANFSAGRVMALLSGNLCYQIEHHLFPDLPSNRYAEISVPVRELCEQYDLPYTTGSLARQYWQTTRTIFKLALPNDYLTATADDAPETASEHRFDGENSYATVPSTRTRMRVPRGLASAIKQKVTATTAARARR